MPVERLCPTPGRTLSPGLLVLALIAATPQSAAAEACLLEGGTTLGTTASGTGSVACGASGLIAGDRVTALGDNIIVFDDEATAIGYAAMATHTGGVAVGALSASDRDYAVALGHGAEAFNDHTIAIGADTQTLGLDSIAIGYQATTGLGHHNAIAIGAGVGTARVNQVAIGNTANTYTLAGIASAASLAAQSGLIQVVTTDANGNLATDGGALSAAITDLDTRVDGHDTAITTLTGQVSGHSTAISNLTSQVNTNTSDIADINARLDAMGGGFAGLSGEIRQNREGIAMAMAMDVPYVPADKEFAMSAALGHFGGSSAFGLSGAWRLGADVQLDVGLGATQSYQGGRVGVTWAW
jgi:hypothetical protein